MFRFRLPLTRSARLFHTSRNVFSAPKRNVNVFQSRFFQGIALGVGIGLTYGLASNVFRTTQKVSLDSIDQVLNEIDNIPPADGIEPFPKTLSVNKVPFSLLATGVRTVTLLNFKVYAVGLYIASEDINRAKPIFQQIAEQLQGSNAPINWAEVLSDEVKGREIFDKLLRSNVRLAIRITPTRKTNFNHLRDGFVRSITNQKESKSIQSAEFGESLDSIKRAFGRKRNLAKGEIITWARDPDGGMTAWYGDGQELLGTAHDADAARLFFLTYLTGPKPNSPSLRNNAVNNLGKLIALLV